MTDNVAITFLGTCGGAEPTPGRHHSSFVVNYHGKLYWFDAGECCSYSAYLGGVDLPATEAIFISHAHIDHMGGLPNLLWTLRKVMRVSPAARDALAGRAIDVLVPDMDVWQACLELMTGGERGFSCPFELQARRCEDGVIYDKNDVRVTALRNRHLGDEEPFMSFSFRAEFGPKRIVYSGDVKSPAECEPILEGCDLLLMETGHHKVEDVCYWLKESGKRVGRLVFVHHGRAILDDPTAEHEKAKAILGEKVSIADDGMVIRL